jgi:small subunit ribosomal protein S17
MKVFTGQVISKKMEKTATVVVNRVVEHPLYKKRYKRTKKYHVQDEIGVEVGQIVKFIASKPYSKTKKWRVVEVIKKMAREVKEGAGNKKTKKKPETTNSGVSKRIIRKKSN